MKKAYLIDRKAVGGGMEYIQRKIAEHHGDECCVFAADRGECTAANVNAWGAELIHVNHLKALLQLFGNPLVRPRGKVIFTVHGIHLRKFDFLPKSLGNLLKRQLRLALERRLYKKCDKLIALTQRDAEDIQRLYGPGLPVVLEPNTLDASTLRRPERLLFKEGEFAFVCIARFDFQKGQDILLEAIGAAQEKLRAKNQRTLFIGNGQTHSKMQCLAKKLGVDDLVVFAGELQDAGIYMICGKVLVAPSRWEGMPYLMLEAVARGRCVIASDCPGNSEVLKDYPEATLFPTGDVIALTRAMQEV